MSERGSFTTEYIYCPKCLAAAETVLLGSHKYLSSVRIPHHNSDEKPWPIIAGKIGGLYAGEEIATVRDEFVPALGPLLCHPLRIVVLAEAGDELFLIVPGSSDAAVKP